MPITAPMPATLPGVRHGLPVGAECESTPWFVLNSNTLQINAASSNTPADVYGILAGSAPNAANVVRMPIPNRRLRYLDLMWLYCYREAEVSSIASGTAPIVHPYLRMRDPAESERLHPHDLVPEIPELANGIWCCAPVSETSGTAPTYNGFTNPLLANRVSGGVVEWSAGAWRFYGVRLMQGRAYAIQGAEELVVAVCQAHSVTLNASEGYLDRGMIIGRLFS